MLVRWICTVWSICAFACLFLLHQTDSAENLGEYSPPNVQHHLSEAHLLLRAQVSLPRDVTHRNGKLPLPVEVLQLLDGVTCSFLFLFLFGSMGINWPSKQSNLVVMATRYSLLVKSFYDNHDQPIVLFKFLLCTWSYCQLTQSCWWPIWNIFLAWRTYCSCCYWNLPTDLFAFQL